MKLRRKIYDGNLSFSAGHFTLFPLRIGENYMS